MQQLLSTKALAAMLGVAEQTIYNRRAAGKDLPPAIKLGHLLRFQASDVDAWLAARCQPSTALCPASVSPARVEQVVAANAG